MLFYNYDKAPNPRVVRMFAAEKAIVLPTYQVDLRGDENRRAPYRTNVNPTGQLPALVLDSGFVLREVLPICEYLEERYPETPLIGATAEERAEARMWSRFIDLRYVEPMSVACVTAEGPIRDHHAPHEHLLPSQVAVHLEGLAQHWLRWINDELAGRQYVCFGRFTLADIHLFCFIDFFEKVGFPYSRELSWIDKHYRAVGARPSAAASAA
jgi:glutathione S-transferase